MDDWTTAIIIDGKVYVDNQRVSVVFMNTTCPAASECVDISPIDAIEDMQLLGEAITLRDESDDYRSAVR